MPATLTLRELNRATLARQLLLERTHLPLRAVLERAGPLQAQYSPSPYIAVWTRLAGFTRSALTRALIRRSVVKATLLRGTLHLVSAREHSYYGAAMAHARRGQWDSSARALGVTPVRLREALEEHLREPREIDEIVALLRGLRGRAPRDTHVRWRVLGAHGGVVHAYPSGAWRQFGSARHVAARHALAAHRDMPAHDAFVHLARHYLAAFGPASRADLGGWSGIPAIHWRGALEELAPTLRVYRAEDGRELLDLARAPRPPADTPAPVRFLPKWDSILLAHARRDRVLPDRYRKALIGPNGDVLPTFLVDGVVAGRWSSTTVRDEARLEIRPFERLARGDRRELLDEGEQLVRFIEPDAARHVVMVVA